MSRSIVGSKRVEGLTKRIWDHYFSSSDFNDRISPLPDQVPLVFTHRLVLDLGLSLGPRSRCRSIDRGEGW